MNVPKKTQETIEILLPELKEKYYLEIQKRLDKQQLSLKVDYHQKK